MGTQVRQSLGRYLYHGILALARSSGVRVACVGNSSSGLKETPAFGCPTVNIGSRQAGRLRGLNVVDAGYDVVEIEAGIRRALFDDSFRSECRVAKNPYWMGDAGPKIADVLASVELGQKMLRKRMTLVGESQGGWFR
jgi:UDP-N-acetylglucosamine 2-epimerase (non-hydrolysing)/GDP/UDP-N,N'-diacetylbacillosamine 2-epimerase (hydrolysing)